MKRLMRLFSRKTPPAAPRRVAIRAGQVVTEVGSSAVLHALFSTISSVLEPAGWGSRYPMTMQRLYRGRLEAEDAAAALEELRAIERALRDVPVSRVVWDIDDPAKPVSPHYTLGSGASDAAGFFVTVNGLDLLRDALIDSVESAVEFAHPVEIITFESPADFFAGSHR